jgi:flagellar biosynthesis protein FlhF
MDVKKFESFSMQETLKLVKTDLGKDAVILSTREYDIVPEGQQTKKRIYEVTATPTAQSKSLATSKNIQKVEFPKISARESRFIPEKPLLPVPTTSTLLTNFHSLEAKEIEAPKVASKDFTLLTQELSRVRKDIEALPQLDIVEQMQEIKIILHELMKEKYKTSYVDTNAHIMDLNIKLRTSGVQESFIAALTSELEALEEPRLRPERFEEPEKVKDYYLDHTIRYFLKYLNIHSTVLDKTDNPKIIGLVGPTGVGKTTTLAKLVAKAKINKQTSVLILSLDTFKIGGREQLKTLSHILDCKFQEVSDLKELPLLLSRSSSYDYIFLDTPGHHVRELSYMNSLRELKDLPLPIDFHIVLSSSMKQRDLDETIRGYKFLNPESLIFTKLDESWSFGEIFNSSLQSRLPISYFTTGQKVPEEIEVATKERVIERLLKI